MIHPSPVKNPSPCGRLVRTSEGSTVDLTTHQAAERLGVSVRRVRQYIEDGRLKARKVGRDYLISKRSLEAFHRLPSGRPPAGRE